jgi:hypothetical protein
MVHRRGWRITQGWLVHDDRLDLLHIRTNWVLAPERGRVRFRFADVIRHPKFLRSWWIEFPPRRLEFYRRRHPGSAQWRRTNVVLAVLLAFFMLLTIYLTVLVMTDADGPWIWWG